MHLRAEPGAEPARARTEPSVRHRAAALVPLLALAGCHVVSRSEISRPAAPRRIHQEPPIARPPRLVLTGHELRLIEPLDCATEEVIAQERAIELETRPNLATFVVGAIATAAGAVLLVRSINDTDSMSSPFFYGGITLAAGGLPLAIGPWTGNHTELRSEPSPPPIRRPGPVEPCGERPVAARAAVLSLGGIEVYSRIDDRGVLAISPYQLVDAFEMSAPPPLDVVARFETPGGPGTATTVLDPSTLVDGARAFLAHGGIDARIEPMRMVPGITGGTLRVSLTSTAEGAAVRIVLPVENAGPGPTWALRGHIIAPGAPAIDGRMIYVGHVAKGAAASREVLIPVSDDAAVALRNATLDVSVELRDAHGTAPTTPVRFRGAVLVDAPR